MIKKLMSLLDYGVFAEVALAIFATVFVAIVVRTWFMKPEAAEQQAAIVLHDENKEL